MEYFQSDLFDTKVTDLMDQLRVPGLSIAVLHGNKTASKAYGVISVASNTPCTANSLFDIASSFKILTAISVALLVEDAKHPSVTFDTPVTQLLSDDFVLSDAEYTKSVTIDDMLSHRTGLPSHDSSYFGVNAERPDDARSVTRNLRNLQLVAPIRSRHIYSNIMYTVATHLVETQADMSFSDFLAARLFAPLHMSSSSLQPSESRQRGFGERISSGHMWDAAGSRYREFPALDCPEGQGAGSIITSAGDYLKLVQALLRHQEQPITEQGFNTTAATPSSASSGVPGFVSRFFFVPSLQLGAVLLGNALKAATVAVRLQKALIDSIILPDAIETAEVEPVTCGPASSSSEFKAVEKEETKPQKMPLTAYTGHYWNPGYRGFHIQIRDARLFVDASDRSFSATLTLRHVSGQTNYLAYAQAADNFGGLPVDEPMRVEVGFDNDRAVKFGLILDPDLDLIWFDRVHAEATSYVFV
ncbi:beta-lactamase family protein [Akanthomyces lecanii RCEF 1005]|uniref:Beta-lactamase family protein n=1 Tax=Akanthomyces lecanii RCEF 1005 TaxID=1081108 RepID=A0A168KNZ7_CORDF|nr:beta-lactamase family protein [Akanthomyces lecanii RCEF 1005]